MVPSMGQIDLFENYIQEDLIKKKIFKKKTSQKYKYEDNFLTSLHKITLNRLTYC